MNDDDDAALALARALGIPTTLANLAHIRGALQSAWFQGWDAGRLDERRGVVPLPPRRPPLPHHRRTVA